MDFDRLLNEDCNEMEPAQIIETSKHILNKVIASDQFKVLVKECLNNEGITSVKRINETIENEIWPRLNNELQRLI